MSTEKFYITTPIYYVNDTPHIGHAYTTILADVLSRYHRMLGVPTWFLTGTDEHGQKVQRAAEKAGTTPQEHADRTVVHFQTLWKKLLITNDDFIRTTEPRHRQVVQKILQNLYDRGEIYQAEYDGWYCVACERFYTEKDLQEGKCPQAGCGRAVEKIKERNYFFRMSKYQAWLIDYIQTHPRFILPEFRRNETLGFLRKALGDLCISRPKTRLSWGIELPFDRDFVTYVWFDALVNYISAVGYLSDEQTFRKWWPASCHLIGKDILTTHTVYWPIMLKAMELPMPETIVAHGWWLAGRDKMSKSSGNVVNPIDFVDRYGVDAFRYFLIAEMALGQDAVFTEAAFVRRYNADLANDLGNLLSRVMKLLATRCGGVIPERGAVGPEEEGLRQTVQSAGAKVAEFARALRPDLAVAEIIAAVREVNRYFEKRQPWALAQQKRDTELRTVLFTAVEALRIISGLMQPVMPSRMQQLRKALGFGEDAVSFTELRQWGLTEPGTAISPMLSLFPRIATDRGAKEIAELSSRDTTPEEKQMTTIEFADFEKVQLRTARVISAERVEGTDKLLKLQIEIGIEKRQIVAGIAQYYRPEDLIGRTVVVVANLKPAKIRGVESNGMLLAASTGSELRLVTVDGEIASGAMVK